MRSAHQLLIINREQISGTTAAWKNNVKRPAAEDIGTREALEVLAASREAYKKKEGTEKKFHPFVKVPARHDPIVLRTGCD